MRARSSGRSTEEYARRAAWPRAARRYASTRSDSASDACAARSRAPALVRGGGVAQVADGHDRDRGEVLVEAEGLGDRGDVEAAHLVREQAVGVRLHRQVRGDLAGVVERPGHRLAVAGGLGDEDDERGGVSGPCGVEAGEGRHDGGVRVAAPAGDDEPPRLGVRAGGGPARGLEGARERRLVERGRRVEDAGAPALGEDVEDRSFGRSGAGEDVRSWRLLGRDRFERDAFGPVHATACTCEVFPGGRRRRRRTAGVRSEHAHRGLRLPLHRARDRSPVRRDPGSA